MGMPRGDGVGAQLVATGAARFLRILAHSNARLEDFAQMPNLEQLYT